MKYDQDWIIGYLLAMHAATRHLLLSNPKTYDALKAQREQLESAMLVLSTTDAQHAAIGEAFDRLLGPVPPLP